MKAKKISLVLGIIAFVLIGILNFLVIKYKILGLKNIDIFLLVVSLVLCLLVFVFNLRKKTRLLSIGLSLLLSVTAIFGITWVLKVKNTFDTLNKRRIVDTLKVVVLTDSQIQSIKELSNINYTLQEDQELIAKFKVDADKKAEKSLEYSSLDTYAQALNKLESKEIDNFVVSDKYISLLESSDPKLLTKIRVIETFTYEREVEDKGERTAQNLDKKQFHVYVSGIDAYGSIDVVSRSDVNIIMSVDLEKGKVLLTSTPRDSYVPIPDGGQNQRDKLTHAGIYGVETSVKTLENLYDIKIPYYIRLNFTSFLEIIDLVGGIEIENDQEFTSLHGNYHFPKGKVQLDSKRALGFVRERYSLINGDVDRAKNQEKIMEALIKKMATPAIIKNADQLLNKISKSMQTNIELPTILSWVNYQVNNGKDLNVNSIALLGNGTLGLKSFAMPNANLYMNVVDEDSLRDVKQKLNEIVGE